MTKEALKSNVPDPPCKDKVGIEGPFHVQCPCITCDGVLKSDGRNVQNNSTFLICSYCGCTYVADDGQ